MAGANVVAIRKHRATAERILTPSDGPALSMAVSL